MIFSIVALIISISIASAGDYYSPYSGFSKPSSTYSFKSNYQESPGFSQFPKTNLNQDSSAGIEASNYDSSSYSRDYRGPIYERKITYLDDFSEEISDDGFLFFSNSKNNLRHIVSSTLTEKYLGATETERYNSQNRRQESSFSNTKNAYNYDGGFSYGKQRLFDSSEYGKDSYTTQYYYRPYYDQKQGNYNWDY